MLKGTNRRIIEINKTDNDYFEKAILFVKTDKSECPPETLNSQADEYLSQLCTNQKKKANRFTVLFTALFILMIAILIYAIVYL